MGSVKIGLVTEMWIQENKIQIQPNLFQGRDGHLYLYIVNIAIDKEIFFKQQKMLIIFLFLYKAYVVGTHKKHLLELRCF